MNPTQADLQDVLNVSVPCRAACPIRTDVPGYIEALVNGDADRAYAINRRDNVFPGVLGRVCHRPCEPACRHGREGLGDPVQICFLKRAASDRATERRAPVAEALNGKRACVIGSGPSGLTVANDLTLAGWQVTVLEQFDAPGGMLQHGIPAFRLPRTVVEQDIAAIVDLGVTIRTGIRVTKQAEFDTLVAEYDAVVVAGGCMQAAQLGGSQHNAFAAAIPGLDYMYDANSGTLGASPQRVVVIGGGFTAVDCARTARRHGATDVTLVYRRTQAQMRVGPNEIAMLNEEGVKQHFLAAPDRLLMDNGNVSGVAFNSVELDASGAIISSTEPGLMLATDQVILAIGQDAEEWSTAGPAGDPASPGVYFTGDFRDGSGTVIEACAAGRQTALTIRRDAGDVPAKDSVQATDIPVERFTRTVSDKHIPLQAVRRRDRSEGLTQDQEVEQGLDAGQMEQEARRCYLCNYVFRISTEDCIYCMKCIDVMPVQCISLTKGATALREGRVEFTPTDNYNRADGIVIDHDACIRCGECARVCPVNCISIERLSVESQP